MSSDGPVTGAGSGRPHPPRMLIAAALERVPASERVGLLSWMEAGARRARDQDLWAAITDWRLHQQL